MINQKCEICNIGKYFLKYSGPIRNGSFGNNIKGDIFRCNNCNVERLDEKLCFNEKDYKNENYRSKLNQKLDLKTYHQNHDHINFINFDVVNKFLLRDKFIADVGCAGGSFLDLVKNITKKSIGIEPNNKFYNHLKKKGYEVYSSLDQANLYKKKLDLITSFQVIEHVQNPVKFLLEIKTLLKENGKIILSTPNLDDILLETLDDYKLFFYRVVHRWYFNKKSIKFCAEKAGLKLEKIIFTQKYGFSNFLLWIRDRSPTGYKKLDFVDTTMNEFWKSYVELNQKSDTIYIVLSKENNKG